MRFSFSAEFLKIVGPAANFGEAWENLCLCLLRAETSDSSIMRLGPPDRGIDIYRQSTRAAYQCKSSERGVHGTINSQDCITSLTTAIAVRNNIRWVEYSIALNAPLSGSGLAKITGFARSQGLPEGCPIVLPPEYWNELCERHAETVRHLFDYRVFVEESQVINAFRKAGYYDRFVQQAIDKIKTDPLAVVVSNNRTPVELTLPFSGDLTIQELLRVVRSLLGISVDWTNFPDLGTSCSPSLSMTVDRVPQAFTLKLSELTEEQRAKLQLWIKLVWRDQLQTDQDDYDGSKVFLRFELPTDMRPKTDRERRGITLDRMESLIQDTIWRSLSNNTDVVRE